MKTGRVMTVADLETMGKEAKSLEATKLLNVSAKT
jgi:hypothetical protein